MCSMSLKFCADSCLTRLKRSSHCCCCVLLNSGPAYLFQGYITHSISRSTKPYRGSASQGPLTALAFQPLGCVCQHPHTEAMMQAANQSNKHLAGIHCNNTYHYREPPPYPGLTRPFYQPGNQLEAGFFSNVLSIVSVNINWLI